MRAGVVRRMEGKREVEALKGWRRPRKDIWVVQGFVGGSRGNKESFELMELAGLRSTDDFIA